MYASLSQIGQQAANTLLWIAVSGIFTIVAIRIYVWMTPYDEFKMIREGNLAASVSLSGTLIGFVLPLAVIISHSGKIADLAVWAFIALAIQLAIFALVAITNRNLRVQMEANNVAAGGWLGAVSLAGGIINAACLIP